MHVRSTSRKPRHFEASYLEKVRLVHTLKKSVIGSRDIVELINRLHAANKGVYAICYILPYDIILTENGFRHGLPGLFNPGYGSHETLRASALKGVPANGRAERCVRSKIQALAADKNASIDIGGADERELTWLAVKRLFRPVRGALSSPIWGPAWCVKKLLANFAPR